MMGFSRHAQGGLGQPLPSELVTSDSCPPTSRLAGLSLFYLYCGRIEREVRKVIKSSSEIRYVFLSRFGIILTIWLGVKEEKAEPTVSDPRVQWEHLPCGCAPSTGRESGDCIPTGLRSPVQLIYWASSLIKSS